MFRKSFNLIPILLLLMMIACKKELFVDDISQRKVALISPSNGAKIESNTVNFQWEKLENIKSYNFQVGAPNFTELNTLVYDVDTISNALQLNLLPGEYEWRVSATNGGFQTFYSTHKLIIDSTEDISTSQIVLISPADSLFTNVNVSAFSWEKLINAEQYNFRINIGYVAGLGDLFTSEISTSDNFITLPKNLENGFYVWSVNAENNRFKSPYSSRFIWYDDIAPAKAVLQTPANNAVIQGGKIDFIWESISNTGSPIHDTLQLYSDPSLQSLIYSKTTDAFTHFDSLATGSYYWRVSRGDKCGNFGGYSDSRTFSIQ